MANNSAPGEELSSSDGSQDGSSPRRRQRKKRLSEMIQKVENIERRSASIISDSTRSSTCRESFNSTTDRSDKDTRRRSDRVNDLLSKVSNLVVEIDNEKMKGRSGPRRKKSNSSMASNSFESEDQMSEVSDGSNIARRVEAIRQNAKLQDSLHEPGPPEVPESVQIR